MSGFLACFSVEVDVDKITILPPPPSLPTLPPYFVSFLPTILYLTQVTVISKQCAPKSGFGAVYLFTFASIGHLEKSFPESIM